MAAPTDICTARDAVSQESRVTLGERWGYPTRQVLRGQDAGLFPLGVSPGSPSRAEPFSSTLTHTAESHGALPCRYCVSCTC